MPIDRICVLFNPSAGGGRALHKREKLEQLLRTYGIPYDLFVTESEENLKELTRVNARSGRTLVGAGGDSTFHIMVNEIIKTGEDVTFGMIGLGSSNDICREFQVDTLEKACLALKTARRTRIDVGRVSSEGTIFKYFLGQANIGLGAWVSKYVENLAGRRPQLGRRQSLAGTFGIISSYLSKRIPVFLTIESEEGKAEGQFILAVFGNIRYWATGREINPAARPDDGWLDACLIKPCSFPRLARLAALSRKGKHARAKEVSFRRSRDFVVSSERPFLVQADGEILEGPREGAFFKSVQFTVIPQALNIIS